MSARERLILALDFASAAESLALLDRIRDSLPPNSQPAWVKVGLELFLAEGPRFVDRLSSDGYSVFLDLKLHDIPNTVGGAVRGVRSLRPALLTVHAAGGPAMLAAAAEAAAGSPTKLLAVTVLTSMDAAQQQATGIAGAPEDRVMRLAALAAANGIDGLVCSPREAAALRSALPGAHLVTPGIRPAGSHADDQHRTSTPAEAIRAGADQLVIGRPVTRAADPAAAFAALLAELAHAG